MTLKEWLFGKPPPLKSEVKEIHDQLVTTVIDHKRSVDDFQRAAEDLLNRMAVQEKVRKRFERQQSGEPEDGGDDQQRSQNH